jgi:hypothetical protein
MNETIAPERGDWTPTVPRDWDPALLRAAAHPDRLRDAARHLRQRKAVAPGGLVRWPWEARWTRAAERRAA